MMKMNQNLENARDFNSQMENHFTILIMTKQLYSLNYFNLDAKRGKLLYSAKKICAELILH